MSHTIAPGQRYRVGTGIVQVLRIVRGEARCCYLGERGGRDVARGAVNFTVEALGHCERILVPLPGWYEVVTPSAAIWKPPREDWLRGYMHCTADSVPKQEQCSHFESGIGGWCAHNYGGLSDACTWAPKK